MLDKLRERLMKKNELHEELVKKYNEKLEAKKAIETEMMDLEKQIIMNQGAMEAINDLGMELMEKEEATTPETEVEVVEA